MTSIASNFVGLKGGLLMSIIAFSIVFLVIVGLMFLMMGLKKVTEAINTMNAAKQAASVTTAPAPSAPAAPSSTPPSAAQSVSAADDGELIAVITAAISALCGAGARIVSYAPAPSRSSTTVWRTTGRLQNSEGFAD